MNDSITKVLVLGLDGATWKVLNPLMKAGFLPTLQSLVRDGVSGTLVSTIPPITSPAWPSMATGLNPGKLGVYSTLRRSKSNIFSLKPVTSSVYRGKAVWDFLSDAGLHVALFKIPFLYPTYEISGCMVSGFGSASKFAAYPSHLHKKLVRGPSSLLEAQLFNRPGSLDLDDVKACIRHIEQVKMIIHREGEVILDLLRSQPWRFLFYVVSATDWLQHFFMDRIARLVTNINSNSSPQLEILDKALIDFYRSVDLLIGQFLKLIQQGDDFAFFIVSDHGFTIRPYTFNLAKWLIKNGYTKLRTVHKHRKNEQNIVSTLVRQADISKSLIGERILDQILKILPRNALRRLVRTYLNAQLISKTNISECVDFGSSRVFCLEDLGIYVNQSAKDAQNRLHEMICDLSQYLSRFPHLALKVYRRSEIYWGSKVQLAPDLIIRIADNNQIWQIDTDPTKPLIFKPRLPGIHDDEGIFVAYGSKIKRNVALGKIKIWDVCPTILHIFGLAAPSNMDGKALNQIFTVEIPEQALSCQVSEKERIKRKLRELKDNLQV